MTDVLFQVGGPERAAIFQPATDQTIVEREHEFSTPRLEGAHYPSSKLGSLGHLLLDLGGPGEVLVYCDSQVNHRA